MLTQEIIIGSLILTVAMVSTYYMYKSFINRMKDNDHELDKSVQEITRNQ
jgi:hypothetical protein